MTVDFGGYLSKMGATCGRLLYLLPLMMMDEPVAPSLLDQPTVMKKPPVRTLYTTASDPEHHDILCMGHVKIITGENDRRCSYYPRLGVS